MALFPFFPSSQTTPPTNTASTATVPQIDTPTNPGRGLLFGNYRSPDQETAALALFSQLANGQTVQDQLNFTPTLLQLQQAATERQKQDATKNQTVAFLQDKAPDLAAAVTSGALTPTDAYTSYFKQQQEAKAANKPEFHQFEDGSYGWVTPGSKQIDIVGTAKKPVQPTFQKFDDGSYGWVNPSDQSVKITGKVDKPDATNLQKDLTAAGLQPGTPEWKQAIISHYQKQGIEVSVDKDGNITYRQGMSTPKVSEDQGKNAGFLVRAQDSEKTLEDLENQGTSFWNKAAQALPMGTGNYVVSPEAQKYNQAKSDFITAALRKESGAVISGEEFKRADQQYFPQPGDSPDVIAQKRDNRNNVIKGFAISAGPATNQIQDQQTPKDGQVKDWSDYFKGQ